VDYLFAGYFVVAMYVSALVSKALGACIAFCLGLALVYPDATKATFLLLLFTPAVVLAAFRD
jgi:hypothetical protein